MGGDGRDPSRKSKSDEDDDEEDEIIEVKYRNLSKEVLLGAVETNSKLRIQIKDKGKWFTKVRFSSLLGSMETLRLT